MTVGGGVGGGETRRLWGVGTWQSQGEQHDGHGVNNMIVILVGWGRVRGQHNGHGGGGGGGGGRGDNKTVMGGTTRWSWGNNMTSQGTTLRSQKGNNKAVTSPED